MRASASHGPSTRLRSRRTPAGDACTHLLLGWAGQGIVIGRQTDVLMDARLTPSMNQPLHLQSLPEAILPGSGLQLSRNWQNGSVLAAECGFQCFEGISLVRVLVFHGRPQQEITGVEPLHEQVIRLLGPYCERLYELNA
jgi:hypothetical protein